MNFDGKVKHQKRPDVKSMSIKYYGGPEVQTVIHTSQQRIFTEGEDIDCAAIECHCEGQKLSEEARNTSVKATKVTAKARHIYCKV